MATAKPAAPAAKKPAPRKKTTKRGPTRAAALKTLGLTKEDLDAIKELRALRESVAAAPAQVTHEGEANLTPASGATLHPAVGNQPAPAVQNTSPTGGPWLARNLRNVEVGIRLERQDKNKKRLNFKPRGQRGDIVSLQEGDLADSGLLSNVELGVIEIITQPEAQKVIEGQTKNAQTAIHPAMALLRNPKGEEYGPNAVQVDPEYNSQGITVAHLDPAQLQGRVDDKSVARGEPVQRVQQANTGGAIHAPLGGNPAIVSDGFARPDVSADAIARQKNLEGPQAAGIATVVVEPVRRT